MFIHHAVFSAVLAVSGMAATSDARAYNEPGHFETARLVVERLPSSLYSAEDKRVIVACAQLPDMVEELDAVRLYFGAFKDSKLQWLRWALGDKLETDPLKRMFAVQQLLHGLTNGDSASMNGVALEIVTRLAVPRGAAAAGDGSSRFEALCASGMSLHLLGDSLAHRQMFWGSQDETAPSSKMYPTGRGHGLSDQHMPDYILCSYLSNDGWNSQTNCHQDWTGAIHVRLQRWRDVWSKGNARLTGQPEVPHLFTDAEIDDVVAHLKAIKTGATAGLENGDPGKNDLGAGDVIVAFLAQHSPHDALLDAFGAEARKADESITTQKPSCDSVLAKIHGFAGNGAAGGSPAPSCRAVWARYSQAAIPAFREAICTPRPASPVDAHWKDDYCQSDGGGKAPIARFSDLVQASMTPPQGAKP